MQIRDLIPWGRRSEAPVRFLSPASESNPISTLHRDIERVFDQFWSRFDLDGFGVRNGFGFATPAIDIAETDEAYEISAELPGLSEEDIDISLTDDVLTLRGEKKAESEDRGKGRYIRERSYGAFYRTIPLPAGIDAGKAEATFRNGVLTVSLPKTEEARAKVRRIEVKKAA